MFSAAVERALRVALEAHAGQLRKSPEPVPYATHCVHVALILARAGADEITLQAGLLHDVLEDCEGWTRARLESELVPLLRRFGPAHDEVRDLMAQVAHIGNRLDFLERVWRRGWRREFEADILGLSEK